MHMADALISPAVGGTMWLVGTAATYYAVRKTRPDFSEQKAPLMGVLGAFVFAAQMINFAIPGTGSSGHLGGGILLSVLLGSHGGFLTMASILTIQALLFADGGLLALGCNIFNLALIPCYIAYPFIYQRLAGSRPSRWRLAAAVTVATIIGLQLGALGVVAETTASGISDLPWRTFALFMLPIHLAIGAVEAAVTTAVLWYIRQEAPTLLSCAGNAPNGHFSVRKMAGIVLVVSLVTAGVFSGFASSSPDGLEWSVLRTAGSEDAGTSGFLHEWAAQCQKKIALFADYQVSFFAAEGTSGAKSDLKSGAAILENISVAGILGSVLTLMIVGAIGAGCCAYARRNVH